MDKKYRVSVTEEDEAGQYIVWESKEPVNEYNLIGEGHLVVNKAFLVAIGKLDPQVQSFEGHIPGDGEGVGERVSFKLDDDPPS